MASEGGGLSRPKNAIYVVTSARTLGGKGGRLERPDFSQSRNFLSALTRKTLVSCVAGTLTVTTLRAGCMWAPFLKWLGPSVRVVGSLKLLPMLHVEDG